mmetsp:Transcript_41025/g.122473  ORF Transcript_41025/g.122473 Transcript_41025/m.122473 type:complete len:217 (-) Transcript_41025:962-1612(-)
MGTWHECRTCYMGGTNGGGVLVMASGSSKVYCGQHVPAAFMSANWHWLLAQKPEPLGPVMLEHGNLSWRQTCTGSSGSCSDESWSSTSMVVPAPFLVSSLSPPMIIVSPNWTEKRAPSHTSFISSRISDRSVLQHGSRASHASDVRSSPHITSPPGMLSPDVMLVTTKLYGEDTFAAQPTNGNADEAGAGNVLGVGSGLAPGRRSPVGGGGAGEGP